ncbi:apolipoprotein N-acyltransferase [Pseudooceanicola sp.]|uniref:apolipoprotein N-acyltransferase n=1 Tax=Pseudooceanicola sp. TaxID=1914328 RepID=UPI002635D184|nr:apolipoprotein N-acyltransferase [Pseudooceanicola sp.]
MADSPIPAPTNPPRRSLRQRLAPPRPKMALLAAAVGALAAMGLAPFNLWPLALLALAALVWLLARASGRADAIWIGWAAGAGYFALALHWIVEPFLVDIARHGWMAPFALIFLAGGLALFWGLAAGLAHLLAPRGALRLVAIVAALTLAELLRGYVLTGFPWALIGHVLIASPLLPLAAWVGPDGLTLLALALAAGLSLLPARPLAAGAPLALVAAGLFLTAPLFAPRPPATAADAPILRLMQPNAAQNEKWDPRMIPVFLDRMLAYSAASPVPDVIIWPETAVPAFLETAPGLMQAIGGQAGGALSVIGIERREDGAYYNSLAVIAPDGQIADVYDKHHLVPFGEYLPLGGLLSRLGLSPLVARYSGFAAGAGPLLVDLGRAGRALPLICYEAVFPRDISAALERPDLLLQITNDAWFGGFSGPFQHLAQARLRAVEQGLPMVRVANTGVSAMIAADGRILGSIPLGQTGYLDLPRPNAAAPTLFSRTGSWPVALLAGLGLLVAALQGWRQLRAPGH